MIRYKNKPTASSTKWKRRTPNTQMGHYAVHRVCVCQITNRVRHVFPSFYLYWNREKKSYSRHRERERERKIKCAEWKMEWTEDICYKSSVVLFAVRLRSTIECKCQSNSLLVHGKFIENRILFESHIYLINSICHRYHCHVCSAHDAWLYTFRDSRFCRFCVEWRTSHAPRS